MSWDLFWLVLLGVAFLVLFGVLMVAIVTRINIPEPGEGPD
jgi:hypothetical protein